MDIPNTDDPDTRGFWEAARRHELAVCACGACGQVLHPPRDHCSRCYERHVVWRVVSRRGSLYSWTVQEYQPDPSYEVPYTVVLVELDDEPEVRLFGSIPGRQELHVGQPMRVVFQTVAPDVVLPQWEPVSSDTALPNDAEFAGSHEPTSGRCSG